MYRPIMLLNLMLTIAVYLLLFHSSYAQNTYKPFKNDSALRASLISKAALRLENDKKAASGEFKKYIAQEYQERFDHVQEMYTSNQFITDVRARKYIDSLVNIILNANPALKPLKPTVLFSRLYWPNAASFGEGTIMFNISLFNRLQNEGQAAFVICHELSHYYLQHSNKAIDLYVNTLYSKDFQEQLRDIKRSEFQKGKNLDKLIKNISYKSRRHSRDHEMEADSMALELLRFSGFDVRESLSCLALLDSIDKEKYLGSLHLNEQLNFAEYPFRKSWLRQNNLTMDEAIRAHEANTARNTKDADSLKTHPDCSIRIVQLRPRVEKYYQESQHLFIVSKPQFDTLVKSFDYELAEYCYESGEVGRALYYSLQQFYNEKNNIYLITLIGKCFNRIYHAQQEHTLGKIVDMTSTTENAEYESFIKFIQSVKLNDIASINYYFMKRELPICSTDHEFAATFKETSTIFSSISN